MKCRTIILSLILFGVANAQAERVTSRHGSLDLPDNVVAYEWPRYPFLARLHDQDGFGLYRLNVDRPSGTVSSVTVVKSTTHQMLDDAAVTAFRKWRFRPNTTQSVTLPGTFTLQGRPLSEARRYAIYAPPPERLRSGRSGSGTFRFLIDHASGRVTDVQVVKPSGRPEFDQAVVKAYRQWRFQPGTIRSVETTVGFGP